MKSNIVDCRITKDAERNKISRRDFFTRGICCTAGLSLLSIPGMISAVSASDTSRSKEEVLRALEAGAEKFMTNYRSCSQASFAALNEQFNLKADRAVDAIKPFAGGIVSQGETCGAVSGSILAMGFYFECVMNKKGSSMMHGKKFFDRFTSEFSSTRCKEVMKHHYGRYIDFQKPEDMKFFMEASAKNGGCVKVIQKAVVMAGEIILAGS